MVMEPPDAHWQCTCGAGGPARSGQGTGSFPCPECGETVYVESNVKGGPERGPEKKY